MIDEPLVFEVQGRTIVVEAVTNGWRAHYRQGSTDHLEAHDIRIPAWVSADELPRFLAGLFDRDGAPGPAMVRRIW